MADINLTQQDIDYIARVVDTEVPRSIKRTNPAEYERMVKAVTDTVTNRMASEQFPSAATDVLNQRRQFSKITGPQNLSPYGSVQNTPKAPADLQNMVAGHIADRMQGQPSVVGGSVNYANPNFSSANNRNWIDRMIESGAEKFGIGRSVHYHGNAPGMQDAGLYTMDAEGIPYGRIATPTPRGQSPGDYGILGVIDPPTVTPVERGLLPDVQRTPQFDQSRFADGAPMGVDQLSGALSQQATNLSAPQSIPTGVLADQYNQYGAGQKAMREATLLGLDAANYDPMARVKESLLAQAADPTHAPVSIDATTMQTAPQATLQMGTPTPQAPGAPASPPYVDPVVTTATQPSMPQMPAIAQPQPSIPQLNRQAAPTNAQAALTGKALADKVGRDLQMRGILGGIGGGLLGGAFLGPVGGLVGGLLGRNAARKTYYPPAPQAAPQDKGGGRASLSDIGKDAYDKSGQFQNAVDSGKQGLW